MGAVQKVSIELSEELVDEVEAGLARGDIESWGVLIEEALHERLMRRPEVIERLRAAWEEGLASGEPIDGFPDVADIERRGREWLNQQR